jgi:hypothetical protein
MRHLVRILILLLALLVMGESQVMASTITGALYRGQINVANSSYASANVSVPFTLKTQNLIDSSQILADCSNVAIVTSTGTDIAFMPAPGASGTAWMVFEPNIAQQQTKNYYLYAGGAAMGGKIRYFPGVTGMTAADAASIELGSAFAVDISGFIDTASGSNKYLVYKYGAIDCRVNGAGTLTANIYSAPGAQITQDTGTADKEVYSLLWKSQIFTAVTDIWVTGAEVYGEEEGTAPNNFVCSLRNVSGGVPSGSDITSGQVVATTFPAVGAPAYVAIAFAAPVFYAAGSQFAITGHLSAGGDASNNIHWKFASGSDPYAGGTLGTSTDGGSTWTSVATDDCRVKVDGIAAVKTVSAAGVATGEHDISISADGTNFELSVDGSVEGSVALSGVSVVNNAGNWTALQNGSVTYLESYEITVGGALKQSISWQNSATQFTDASGNANHATPSFSTTSSDADVSAQLKSYAPLTPATGGVVLTTSVSPPLTSVPAEPDVSGVGPYGITNIPGGTSVVDFLEDNNIPVGLAVYPAAMLLLVLVIFLLFAITRDIGWVGIGLFCVDGLLVAWRIIPWPSLFFFGVVVAFTLIKRGGMSRA